MKVQTMKEKYFFSTQTILLVIICLMITSIAKANNEVDPYLKEIVDFTKNSQKLPYSINPHTVWKDIYPDGKSLHYLYLISEEASKEFDLKSNKNILIPTLCSGMSLELLDKGYFFQVTYEIENSSKKNNFSVTKSDCQNFLSKTPDEQKKDAIKTYVDLIKTNIQFPKSVDQSLVWVDVAPDNNSIRNIYEVDLSKFEQEFSEKTFKSYFMSSACNPSIKAIYDQGYFFKYAIKVKNSSKELNFDMKKSDCEVYYSENSDDKIPTKEEVKNFMINYVKEINNKTDYPYRLDEATTWLSTELGENSIIHRYEVDPESFKQSFTQDNLKSIVLPGICSNKMVSVFSQYEFFIEYIYSLKGSSEKMTLKINEEECKS